MLNQRSVPPPAGAWWPPNHAAAFVYLPTKSEADSIAPGRPVYPPGDPRRGS